MLISILSLVYNHAPYLAAFFEGILSQKFPHQYEIVIGIDESSDSSLDICRHYQQQNPDIIKIIEHKERVGMISNFIATYNACSGKYIAVCEGDDYWIDNQKLTKQVAVLENNVDAVICFTDIKIFDQENGSFHPNWATITKDKYFIKDIIHSNSISFCSTLFRNKIVKLNDESYKGLSMADWPLYIQLLRSGHAFFLNEQTAVYRRSFLSSYSKTPVVDQLLKKKETIKYLLNLPELCAYNKELMKAYFYIIYAIAIRLKGTDVRRNIFLKEIISNFSFDNVVLSLKAIFHRLSINNNN